jgi:hypothetical protein
VRMRATFGGCAVSGMLAMLACAGKETGAHQSRADGGVTMPAASNAGASPSARTVTPLDLDAGSGRVGGARQRAS